MCLRSLIARREDSQPKFHPPVSSTPSRRRAKGEQSKNRCYSCTLCCQRPPRGLGEASGLPGVIWPAGLPFYVGLPSHRTVLLPRHRKYFTTQSICAILIPVCESK